MSAQAPQVAPVPDLSLFQVGCWAALGRLLSPFLPVEAVAATKAADASAGEKVSAAASGTGIQPQAGVDRTDGEVEGVAPFDLEVWFPTAGITPQPAASPIVEREPLAATRQAAGEFFAALAWTPADASREDSPPVPPKAAPGENVASASEFFSHAVAWGGGAPVAPANLGGSVPPTGDPLGARMMAAATLSAVHLSRKLSGKSSPPANAAESAGTARDFFSSLDWHAPALAA